MCAYLLLLSVHYSYIRCIEIQGYDVQFTEGQEEPWPSHRARLQKSSQRRIQRTTETVPNIRLVCGNGKGKLSGFL